MSYKDTNITNPGTSIKYGADDMEKISRLFNGVTSGVGGPMIKTQDKWGFWDGIMYVRNQADTFNTTIRGAAVQTNNWDLALPNLLANDTLAAIGIQNVWGVKQQLEAGTMFKQQSAPVNPPSTYHHLYVNGSGQLVKRNSTGAEVTYDALGTGSGAALIDYSARVFKVGSNYIASDSNGNVISQGAVFETVAQAALDLKGTVLFAGPNTLAASGSFTGLNLDEKTHLIIERGCICTVPNAYTGHFIRALDKEKWIISCFGAIEEAGSPVRNWTGIFVDAAAVDVMHSQILIAHINNASTALRLRATGAGIDIKLNTFQNITAKDCKKTVLFEEVSSGSIDNNTFTSVNTQSLAGVTTDGFKDVNGNRNDFYGCMLIGNNGTVNEMNILNSATNTLVVGGNLGAIVGITDNSLSTIYLNTVVGLKVDSGFLSLKNPAGTFTYNHVASAITGNINVTYPLLTADANFVFDSFSNLFTTGQTIRRTTAADFLTFYKQSNSVGTGSDLQVDFHTANGTRQVFTRIRSELLDNSNTLWDGRIKLRPAVNGVDTDVMTADGVEIKHIVPVKNEDYMDLKAISAPAAPASGYVRVFLSTDGHMKYKRSNNDEVVFD